MNLPFLTGTPAPALWLELKPFLCDLSAADFVLVVDRLVGPKPVLRDLALGHSPRLASAPAQKDPDAVVSHVNRPTLQRYEISALFVHAGLPLFGSQDTLRELNITICDRDTAAACDFMLEWLERATLRRLRHLVVVNRAACLPLNFAPRLRSACPTVRALMLITIRLSPESYEYIDKALLTPGLRISALVVALRSLTMPSWTACGVLVGCGAYRSPKNPMCETVIDSVLHQDAGEWLGPPFTDILSTYLTPIQLLTASIPAPIHLESERQNSCLKARLIVVCQYASGTSALRFARQPEIPLLALRDHPRKMYTTLLEQDSPFLHTALT